MRRPEKKTMVLTIRIEESTGTALKELAAEDERKLSAYVARILRRHVKEARGEPIPKPKRPKD
jgi:hypothetical protein